MIAAVATDRYVPGVGQVDVSDAVKVAFRDGRVLAIDQRDWRVVVKLRVDDVAGPLTLEELDDLARALRLDRTAVTVWIPAVSDVLELQLDLDAPTPVDDPRRARR